MSVVMAPVMAFIAVKMFWKMHLAKAFLSSSEKPRPWMILICRMKVVFPLSPVPEATSRIENNYQTLLEKVAQGFSLNLPVFLGENSKKTSKVCLFQDSVLDKWFNR